MDECRRSSDAVRQIPAYVGMTLTVVGMTLTVVGMAWIAAGMVCTALVGVIVACGVDVSGGGNGRVRWWQ